MKVYGERQGRFQAKFEIIIPSPLDPRTWSQNPVALTDGSIAPLAGLADPRRSDGIFFKTHR